MNKSTHAITLAQLLENDSESKAYFDSLPEFIRETLMQSKGLISDAAELKSCAENIRAK